MHVYNEKELRETLKKAGFVKTRVYVKGKQICLVSQKGLPNP